MATFHVSRGGNRVRVRRPCEKLSVEFFKVGSVVVGEGSGMWHWYFSRAERGLWGNEAMKVLHRAGYGGINFVLKCVGRG